MGSVRSGSRGTKSLFVEPSLPGRSPVFSGVCTASEAQDLGLSSSGRTRSDRSDEEDTGPPVLPRLAQPGPQESIRCGQFRPLDGALQNAELMAQGEDF
jgi:hypothetical protein